MLFGKDGNTCADPKAMQAALKRFFKFTFCKEQEKKRSSLGKKAGNACNFQKYMVNCRMTQRAKEI